MLRKRRFWWALLLICLIAIGGVLSHALWMPLVPQMLMIQQPLEKADLIYLLGGDHYLRAPFAAKLFREGWAPLVAVPRQAMPRGTTPDRDFTNVTLKILRAEGVPANRSIEVFYKDGVTSTADEARALRNYVNQIPVCRVIVVTSSWHGRRAYLTMRRALWGTGAKVTLATIEQPGFDIRHWWQKTDQKRIVELEYAKLIYYWFAFYR